jgi:hypothetical protein
MVTYTEEELNYREDLTQKLLTLEHVKSVLIGRGDDPLFVNQIVDMQNIVKQWMAQAVRDKQLQQQQQGLVKDGGQPPAGKQEPEPEEESGEDE